MIFELDYLMKMHYQHEIRAVLVQGTIDLAIEHIKLHRILL